MTISLVFLAPDLVKAAIEGRLPHGMGVVRLADLPAEWSRLSRFQVDDQIEFGGLFHRQIARVGALQRSIYNAS